jgi:hypothetical protein
VQNECLAHEGLGNGVSLRDVGRFRIEHTGEGEQGVALVLQRDTHRADAPHVLRLAGGEFRDDEVEQLSPRRQRRTGQGQNVVAQPLNKRSDVASELMGSGFSLSRTFQVGGKLVVWPPQAGASGLGLQHLAPRGGTLGEARQRVGEPVALVLDVEHVAMARRVAPGGPLPGAQALASIGDRVVGPQPLLGGIQQMYTPGVGITALLCRQEIAAGRLGIAPASTGVAPWKISSCRPT